MKKLIVAFALLMALCLALSVAMADDLADSKSIINLMYKNKPASTPKDYELIGTIPIEDKVYEIEWTTDSDTIQVIREESGKVIIDVDEDNPQEVNYVLTATVKDEAGNSVIFQKNAEEPIEADVIIIDEMSMVDIMLFKALLSAVPLSSRLILVGDAADWKHRPGQLLSELFGIAVPAEMNFGTEW